LARSAESGDKEGREGPHAAATRAEVQRQGGHGFSYGWGRPKTGETRAADTPAARRNGEQGTVHVHSKASVVSQSPAFIGISLTDNTTSPAKVSIKSQCYGTSIIHLTHTNVGTRKAARQRGGGWRRRSQLPGRNRSQRPRANFFKRRHAGETGSERSSFRDNNRSCTPAQSKNMGG
jgi:hypothetical protein